MIRNFLVATAMACLAFACMYDNEKEDEEEMTIEAPSTVDTSIHPNGVNSGGVTSTDTGAMRVVDSNEN